MAATTLRHPEILALARAGGKVTVEDLAARFGVSVQTIRRDLATLADDGRLERVHGGAVLPSGVANIAYEERRALNAAAKTAIGRACAAAIPPGASVCLNIGTTTEAVARALAGHRDLMVITNNLNVAATLAAAEGCEVVVTGGRLRRADAGLVGHLAAATVAEFRVDYAVIGCSALAPEGDLLDFDLAEVEVSRAILSRARHRFLVADHSKLARGAPARIAALSEIDRLFTDRPLPAPLAARCAEWGTAVEVCPAA